MKLFEISQEVRFRICSEEIHVFDTASMLNDDQLKVIAKVFWGASVKVEIVRTTETIRNDTSVAQRAELEEKIEHILIKKVVDTE